MNNPQNAIVQFSIRSQAYKRTELTETILPAFQAVFDTGSGSAGTYGAYSFETRQIRGPFAEPDDPSVIRLDIDYDVQAIPA